MPGSVRILHRGPVRPRGPAGERLQHQRQRQPARHCRRLESHRKGQRHGKLQQEPVVVLLQVHESAPEALAGQSQYMQVAGRSSAITSAATCCTVSLPTSTLTTSVLLTEGGSTGCPMLQTAQAIRAQSNADTSSAALLHCGLQVPETRSHGRPCATCCRTPAGTTAPSRAS